MKQRKKNITDEERKAPFLPPLRTQTRSACPPPGSAFRTAAPHSRPAAGQSDGRTDGQTVGWTDGHRQPPPSPGQGCRQGGQEGPGEQRLGGPCPQPGRGGEGSPLATPGGPAWGFVFFSFPPPPARLLGCCSCRMGADGCLGELTPTRLRPLRQWGLEMPPSPGKCYPSPRCCPLPVPSGGGGGGSGGQQAGCSALSSRVCNPRAPSEVHPVGAPGPFWAAGPCPGCCPMAKHQTGDPKCPTPAGGWSPGWGVLGPGVVGCWSPGWRVLEPRCARAGGVQVVPEPWVCGCQTWGAEDPSP